MLDERELGAMLVAAKDGGSVFRWESRRAYAVDSDGGDFERYVQGLPGPSMTRKQGWLKLLRTESARGVHWHRVRLVQPPLSDYERYECEWSYQFNTAAGDDCRILDTSDMHVPDIRPRDFWIVDNSRVADMHYDDGGHYLGSELITGDIGGFIAARDTLWSAAEPFYSWWDRHPEHRRDSRRTQVDTHSGTAV